MTTEPSTFPFPAIPSDDRLLGAPSRRSRWAVLCGAAAVLLTVLAGVSVVMGARYAERLGESRGWVPAAGAVFELTPGAMVQATTASWELPARCVAGRVWLTGPMRLLSLPGGAMQVLDHGIIDTPAVPLDQPRSCARVVHIDAASLRWATAHGELQPVGVQAPTEMSGRRP